MEPGGLQSVYGVPESWTQLRDFDFHFPFKSHTGNFRKRAVTSATSPTHVLAG